MRSFFALRRFSHGLKTKQIGKQQIAPQGAIQSMHFLEKQKISQLIRPTN